jgi:hypothetical protein
MEALNEDIRQTRRGKSNLYIIWFNSRGNYCGIRVNNNIRIRECVNMKIKKLGEATAEDGKGDYDKNLIFNEYNALRWIMIAMTAILIQENIIAGLILPVMFNIYSRYERTDRNIRPLKGN